MLRITGMLRKHINDFESFVQAKLKLGESEWLRQFREDCKIDAMQFSEIWNQYDTDGNGYIDGDEIDAFFNALVSEGMQHKRMTEAERLQLKQEFMDEFDENRDGKIEMVELVKILPAEENFLTVFRSDNKEITIKEFMDVWRRFAVNDKAYIEAHEVEAFLRELLRISDDTKLQHYAKTVIKIYDSNNDGRLSFAEMSRLLPPHENVLLKFRDQLQISPENFEELFNSYDTDGNGSIGGQELDVFLSDIAKGLGTDIADNPEELAKIKHMLLVSCDESGDGDLQKDEIALWLGVELHEPQQT